MSGKKPFNPNLPIADMPKDDDKPPVVVTDKKTNLTVGPLAAKKYARRIEASLDLQRKQIPRWKDASLKLNNGINPDTDETVPEEDELTLNLYKSTLEGFVASIYSRNPYIYIYPGQTLLDQEADTAERLVNHDFDVLNVKPKNKRVVKDAWLYGVGFSKTGINAKGDTSFSVNKTSRNYEWLVGSSGIFHERVSPFDVLPAADARNWDTSQYLAHRLIYPLYYVKKNKSYEHTDLIPPGMEMQGDQVYEDDYALEMMRMSRGGGWSRAVPQDMKRVVLWEIWDRELEIVVTMADGLRDKVLRVRKMEYWPWNALVFWEIPDRLYSMPDMAAWEDLVNKLEAAINIQLDHMREFNLKILYEGDAAIHEDDLPALRSYEDNVVKVKDAKSFDVLKKSSMNADVYRISSTLMELLRQQSGMNEFQRGGFSGGASATEAAIVDSLSKLRIGEKIDSTETYSKRLAQQLLELRQTYPFDPQYLPASQNNPQTQPIKVTQEMIMGPLFAKIVAGTTTPRDKESEKQDAITLWNLFSVAPQIFSLEQLGRDVFEAFGKQDVGKYFAQQPADQGNGLEEEKFGEGGETSPFESIPGGTPFPDEGVQTLTGGESEVFQ